MCGIFCGTLRYMFILFYTNICEFCSDVMRNLKVLEESKQIKVQYINVEKKGEDQDLFNAVDNIAGCGGVPLLYYEPTSKSLCGGVSEKELVAFIEECLLENKNI